MTAEPGEEVLWAVLTDLGVQHSRLRELWEILRADFDSSDFGFRSMGMIPDELQRAVVSDQICQTARAVASNLLEAKLHQQELSSSLGADGIRFPDEATVRDTFVQSVRTDMSITAFVRALGSVLDCLAAVAVGVLRMPFSLSRASFANVAQAATPGVLAKGTSDQKRLWSDFNNLCESHRDKPPSGWLDWLIGMRNLNVHRARQVHMLLQRTRAQDQPQIILYDVDPDQINKRMARFDLHLRKRPHLPDMQDFVTTSSVGDLWINERAETTLAGAFSVVVDLVEEACHYLGSAWGYAAKWSSVFPPPIAQWALATPPWASFDGFAPATAPFPLAQLRVSGHEAQRMALVQSLRP